MFLGDHGWFDKRFIYEDSFQMPFLVRYPNGGIKPGSVSKDIVQNVDFGATMLDVAGLAIPSYMQGKSFKDSLTGTTPKDWDQLAYHRYWMHDDPIHHAYAHYGVRDRRYRLMYWCAFPFLCASMPFADRESRYNLGFGLPGTQIGGEDQQWELFDTEKDPFELFNVFSEAEYRDVREQMIKKLETKMMQIGDEWVHDVSELEEIGLRPS